jgi:hypothetical protein
VEEEPEFRLNWERRVLHPYDLPKIPEQKIKELEFFEQCPVERSKSKSGLESEIEIRLSRQRFSNAIGNAMKFFHSRFDEKFEIKVCQKISNRDPISNSKSKLDENFRIKVCSTIFKRGISWEINPGKFQISHRDTCGNLLFTIRIRLQTLNQGLTVIFESSSGFNYNFKNNAFEQKYRVDSPGHCCR